MIPKVAHFYWYGERAMPRLRQAGIDSFKAFNPDWQVFVHHSGENPEATFRERVIASDAARYGVIFRAGGVYFDTDILFEKPIPEEWLERSLLLPVTDEGKMYGVHVLGAEPEHQFFRLAMDKVRTRMQSPRVLNCQSLGVKLWHGVHLLDLAARMGTTLRRVPTEAFLTHDWNAVEDLWSEPAPVRSPSIGLHWYGGDRLSQEMEEKSIDELPRCAVRQAWEASVECSRVL